MDTQDEVPRGLKDLYSRKPRGCYRLGLSASPARELDRSYGSTASRLPLLALAIDLETQPALR